MYIKVWRDTLTISCVNFATVSLLKTTAFSKEPNFKLIENGEFFPMVTCCLCSTKRCRRLTNYVYPQKCKKCCFMERRSLNCTWHLEWWILEYTETISYSWYACTFVVLKNKCLIYYDFFDNVFFSYQRVIIVSRYIL